MKILSLKNLRKQISSIQSRQKIVFFSGAFDLFHFGHFKALKKASTLGDILIVQIDGNKLVRKRKGPSRPYLDQSFRAEIIASFEFVNYVFISDIPSEDIKTLKALEPDIFTRSILSHETNVDRLNREKLIFKKTPKTKIVWIEQTPEISTSKILPVVEDMKLGSLQVNSLPILS